MIPTQTLESYPVFGDNATKIKPGDTKYANGFIEGDVYPAEWVNWKWAKDSKGIADANTGLCSIEQEINNVLTCAGITPNLSCTNQLYNAMLCKIQDCVGTAAPKAHASAETTYGVGTADCYGHLKISDTYTSVLESCTGVAASQMAVACVYGIANGKAAVGNTVACDWGTASAGTATTAARSDHVHPMSKCLCLDYFSGSFERPVLISTGTDSCCAWQAGTVGISVGSKITFNPGTGVLSTNVFRGNIADACVSNCCITFSYAAADVASPQWIAAWSGYQLRATCRDKLCVGCAGKAFGLKPTRTQPSGPHLQIICMGQGCAACVIGWNIPEGPEGTSINKRYSFIPLDYS